RKPSGPQKQSGLHFGRSPVPHPPSVQIGAAPLLHLHRRGPNCGRLTDANVLPQAERLEGTLPALLTRPWLEAPNGSAGASFCPCRSPRIKYRAADISAVRNGPPAPHTSNRCPTPDRPAQPPLRTIREATLHRAA